MPDEQQIAARKREHMEIVAREDIAHRRSAGWEDVHLVHSALPEVDFDAVDLGVDFLGHRLAAPLVIAGMTGGHPQALEVNAALAGAAERYGLAMGVGSQRAALLAPSLEPTYAVARQSAPSAFLLANIGAAQLVDQASGPAATVQQVERLVAMIRANALAVHLNFLEELVQPEGDRRARGCLAAVQRLCQSLSVPVVAKETGAGIARSVARALAEAGVAALDVGGAGGTSFAAVESIRAARRGDARGERLGALYRDWGLSTAVAVVEARTAGLPVIATGGIRTGLDAARALALGADLVGVGRPLLQAALAGRDELDRWIEQFLFELRAAAFLTGASSVRELRAREPIVLGTTRQWLQALGHLP